MSSAALEAFDEKLAKSNMRGQWKSEGFLSAAIGGPKPAGIPCHWRFQDVMNFLSEAEHVMPESLQARRSLIFQNPGLARGTTHTINMGIQMIVPGETAWAHRHSIAALRFIISGDQALTTVVDGERCIMEDHDLILTPNWAWHDHHNESARRTLWLDVLDVPLVLGLNQVFHEPGQAQVQPPATPGRPAQGSLRFPWREVEPRLRAAALDARYGHRFDYAGADGRPVLPTLGCRALLLPPGFRGAAGRRTSSAVYHVVHGQGALQAGDTRLEWTTGDCFAVPNWMPNRLVNLSQEHEAVLFSVDDSPALEALGLYREDTAVVLPELTI